MNCEQCKERLVDYLYEEVDQATRAQMDAALESCPECRQALAELRATHAAFMTLEPIEVPAQLHNDILRAARVSALERHPERGILARLFAAPAFGVVFSVVLLAGGAWLFRTIAFERSDMVASSESLSAGSAQESAREGARGTQVARAEEPAERSAEDELLDFAPAPAALDDGLQEADDAVAEGASELALRAARSADGAAEAPARLAQERSSRDSASGAATARSRSQNLGGVADVAPSEPRSDPPRPSAPAAVAAAPEPEVHEELVAQGVGSRGPAVEGFEDRGGAEALRERERDTAVGRGGGAGAAAPGVASGSAAAAAPALEAEAELYGADALDEVEDEEEAEEVQSGDPVSLAYARGEAAFEAGNMARAASELQGFLSLSSAGDARREEALMMSGIALMRSGRLALAEGTLMQLLEEFPRSAHRADAEVLLQDIRREAEPAPRRNRAEETRQFDADAPEMERAPASAPPRPSRAPSE